MRTLKHSRHPLPTIVGLAAILCVAGATVPVFAGHEVCPSLQAEHQQRKQQLHLQLVSGRRAARHQYAQRLLYLNSQRSQVAALCPAERAAALNQLKYQRQLAHQQLQAQLQRLNYEQQIARRQLAEWYADRQHQAYCGSCAVCRVPAPAHQYLVGPGVNVGYGMHGSALSVGFDHTDFYRSSGYRLGAKHGSFTPGCGGPAGQKSRGGVQFSVSFAR